MMCEFHDSNCNGFGDMWWTDKCTYFSSIVGQMRRSCCILQRLRPLLEFYFRGEEYFAKFHSRWILFSREENFAQNPNSRIAKISSTRKIGVIQYIKI